MLYVAFKTFIVFQIYHFYNKKNLKIAFKSFLFKDNLGKLE